MKKIFIAAVLAMSVAACTDVPEPQPVQPVPTDEVVERPSDLIPKPKPGQQIP